MKTPVERIAACRLVKKRMILCSEDSEKRKYVNWRKLPCNCISVFNCTSTSIYDHKLPGCKRHDYRKEKLERRAAETHVSPSHDPCAIYHMRSANTLNATSDAISRLNSKPAVLSLSTRSDCNANERSGYNLTTERRTSSVPVFANMRPGEMLRM